MKTLKTLSILLILGSLSSFSFVSSTDSILSKISEQNETRLNRDSVHFAEINKKLTIISDTINHSSLNACFTCQNKQISPGKGILIASPIILGILFISYFIYELKKNSFNFAEAVSGKVLEKSSNESKGVKQIEDKYIGSTSRLLAFITGLSAIVIALCLTCFYGYYMISECNGKMEFDGLWNILIGLGIGVIPYGINVWNGNEKENNSSTPNS